MAIEDVGKRFCVMLRTGNVASLQFDYIFVESCRMLAFHK